MRLIIFLSGSLLVLLLWQCRPGPADRFAGARRQSAELLRPLLAAHPGIAIAVGWRDGVVWDTAFGYADVATRTPLRAGDVLRYYSLSKPITGVAVAQLAARGRLDLEAPVSQYLDLPPAYDRVTIHQLLNHTAGVRHYDREGGEWRAISQTHCATVAEALPLFTGDSLLFPPGAGHTYSTFGYVLLSRVVEVAAGQPFGEYLRRYIFTPAGMTATRFPGEPGAAPVTFYQTATEAAPPDDNSCRWGGGALLGTTADLVRFGLALLNHRLLSPAMTDRALSVLPAFPGAPAYGFGFGIGDHHAVYPQLPYFAGHSGAGRGGLALFVIFPEQELVLALLSNRQGDEKKATDVFVEVCEAFLASGKSPGYGK